MIILHIRNSKNANVMLYILFYMKSLDSGGRDATHTGQHTPPRRTVHATTLNSAHHARQHTPPRGQHTPRWAAHAKPRQTAHATPDSTRNHSGQHMPCHAGQHMPRHWTARATPHQTAHVTLDSTRHAGQHAPHRIAHTTRPTTSCFPLKIYKFGRFQ